MNLINSFLESAEYAVFLAALLITHTASQIHFISRYHGKTVKGLVGSSVNFTWTFSNGVETVTWGLKRNNFYGIDDNGRLVSLGKIGPNKITVPQSYAGRVSGSRSGDSSSGQAIFTLSNIKKNDERGYGCRISPDGPFSPVFDSVYLLVEETPKITHLTSANASYNEGSPVNISCKATGTPDPDVKWIHNGQVKSSGVKTAHVTFSKMSKEDSGMFTCSANNSAGITEKQIYLIVKCEYTHFLQAILKKETKINQKYKV